MRMYGFSIMEVMTMSKILRLILLTGLCLFILTACGVDTGELVLPEFFQAQSHEELFDMMSEADENADNLLYDEVYLLFNMPGRAIEEYLEDFDFLTSLADEYLTSDLELIPK